MDASSCAAACRWLAVWLLPGLLCCQPVGTIGEATFLVGMFPSWWRRRWGTEKIREPFRSLASPSTTQTRPNTFIVQLRSGVCFNFRGGAVGAASNRVDGNPAEPPRLVGTPRNDDVIST